MEEKTFNPKDIDNEISYSIKGDGDIQVCILSLLHGDEYSGLQVNNEIMNKINPGENGRVVSFPIMNPGGFLRNKREHPKYGDLNRSPLGKVGTNEPVDFIKQIYDEFLSDSDLVIDLHSWSNKSEKFILLDRIDVDKVGMKKAKEMRNKMIHVSSNINLPILEDQYSGRNYLLEVLINESSIPSIKIELGDHIMTDQKRTREISDRIASSIEHFIENPNVEFPKRYIKNIDYHKAIYLSSSVSGEVHPVANEGDLVEKGDEVFYVEKGNSKVYTKAPSDGWVAAYNVDFNTSEFDKKVCLFASQTDEDTLIKEKPS